MRKKDTGGIYAMKALKKKTLVMKKQLKYAISEANVLKMTSHPFILNLLFAFQVYLNNLIFYKTIKDKGIFIFGHRLL